jgi:4'-phosphopantetheinyl transferase
MQPEKGGIRIIRLVRGGLEHIGPGVLSAEENARFALRKDFRGADFIRQVRCALRLALGHCLSLPPAEVRIRTSDDGKPMLDRRQSDEWAFSVSHSDHTALIAIGRARSIGVDVEDIDGAMDWTEVIDLTFSPVAAAHLRSLNPEQGRRAFYRGWTRKEAVAKAIGTGLLTDPRDIEVPLGDRISCQVATPTSAGLDLMDISRDGYIAAVAADAIDREPTHMTLQSFLDSDPG